MYDNDLLIPFRKSDRWGFCNEKKEIRIEPKYSMVKNYFEGFAIVYLPNKPIINIINKFGDNIIPDGYEPRFFGFNSSYDRYFYEGLGIIEKNKKKGFVNELGEIIIAPIFDEVTNFTEGLAGVLKDKKWGFINQEGKLIIDYKYVRIGVYYDDSSTRYHGPFRNGFARVADGINLWFKYSYIDKEGNLLTDFNYDYAEDFHFGVAKVGLSKYHGKKIGYELEYGLIDNKGHIIVQTIYDNIDLEYIKDGFAVLELKNNRGLLDIKKNVVIDCKHDFIVKKYNDSICNNDRGLDVFLTSKGYINSNGTEYWEE